MRAKRRHFNRLHKKKAYLKLNYRYANTVSNNLAICSKQCCGNPRKWYGHKTLQELKIDMSTSEQLNG